MALQYPLLVERRNYSTSHIYFYTVANINMVCARDGFFFENGQICYFGGVLIHTDMPVTRDKETSQIMLQMVDCTRKCGSLMRAVCWSFSGPHNNNLTMFLVLKQISVVHTLRGDYSIISKNRA